MKVKGRGSSDYAVEANSVIVVIRWLDSAIVQLASNFVGNDLGDQARRYDKKNKIFVEIDRPLMVQLYNASMGGVDLCDMLLSLYRIRYRSNKYYMHIFFYCLGISITNGWLLYRRHMNQLRVPAKSQLKLVQFQAQIAEGLRQAGKVPFSETRRRGRRPSLDLIPPSTKRNNGTTVPIPVKDVRCD